MAMRWRGAEQQAALLRRAARGERVNAIDWHHVVEEIGDVGLSELSAVKSHLRQLLICLLKLHGRPNIKTVEHWLNEAIQFQGEAKSRFLSSIRQRIDIAPLCASALRIVTALRLDGVPPRALPATCDLPSTTR